MRYSGSYYEVIGMPRRHDSMYRQACRGLIQMKGNDSVDPVIGGFLVMLIGFVLIGLVFYGLRRLGFNITMRASPGERERRAKENREIAQSIEDEEEWQDDMRRRIR